MLNTLGQIHNRPFYLYRIIKESSEALGVLLNYCRQGSENLVLLPHEQISMSHAMKIKKLLQTETITLPPCALIAELDFSVLNWQENSEQISRWYDNKNHSEHYLYRLKGDDNTQALAEQLARQEALLIADGHHRAFASSLPHAPLATMPVWLTSTSVAVNSFALSLKTKAGFDWHALQQQLKNFAIVACSPSDAHYVFSYRRQQTSYCYSAARGDSYKIQHQIRTALKQIENVANLSPVPQKQLPALARSADTLLIELTAPRISDIIDAAKKGHYFPEKSTYFPHKTCARVLNELSAAC
ncbi:DUF1015 family protein [Thalassomonas viridans]|uniref:DUF1015 family protein n=1 Tax=Thalassomonas viridans TaxID=137584 RepID=A0AAF0CDU0_9GAMM|nr:DUF1015 family protein [Thalassomonas viridans]WDE09046.1 DUF1015 family protein [Thalassomonas viridans]